LPPSIERLIRDAGARVVMPMSRSPRRSARGSLGPLEGTAELAVASRALRARVLAEVHAHPARRPPLSWLAAGLAPRAARRAPSALVLALTVTAALLWLSAPGASPGHRAQYSGTVFSGQRGARAELRELGDEAELRVSGLAPAGARRAYQVWLLAGGGTKPRATDVLFTVSRRGTASVAVPGRLRGVREVLVTSEPRGGSILPSTRPALAVVLAATAG
jgi:hypothetical protein